MKKISLITLLILSLVVIPMLTSCDKNKENKKEYEIEERVENIEYGVMGMEAISNTKKMAYLNPNVFNYGDGSYSKENTNSDGFLNDNFLYIEDDMYVICDVKGKGMLTRMWALAYHVNGNNKFYFYLDGELVIEDTYNNIINGTNPKIEKAFATYEPKGTFVEFYFSIKFESSLKIMMDAPFGFWQVDYALVDDATDNFTKTTFEEDYKVESIILSNLGNPTVSYASTFNNDFNIKANNKIEVLNLEGPKQISFIQVKIDGLNLTEDFTYQKESYRDLLNGLKLKMYWDQEDTPSVDAPFALLFGAGSFGYNHKVKSFMYGINGDTLYLNFPMPFKKNAKIEILNEYTKDVNLSVKIGYSDFKDSFYNVGYFTTNYSNYYIPYEDPFEAVMLNVKGTGKVVSIQENIFGSVGDVLYEEGDHRFYIDGAKVAQMIGTGTEDFYNGAGYFLDSTTGKSKEGLNSLNFCGYTNYFFKTEDNVTSNGVSMYREFVTDPINFRNKILMTFEHGGGEYDRRPNRTMNLNQSAGYEVLVCYYYKPLTKMSITDEINLSSNSDITSHNYLSNSESYNVTSAFYGSFSILKEEKTFFKTSEEISFNMKLAKDNYGAVLYRIYDAINIEDALVYVDDMLAGEWYKPYTNTFFEFADSYFVINEKYTKNKDEIKIKIVPVGENPWSSSSYVLYSMCDRALEEDTFKTGDIYSISSKNKYLSADFDIMENDYLGTLTLVNNISGSGEYFRLFKYHDGSYFIINNKNGSLLGANSGKIECRIYPNRSISKAETWIIEESKKGYYLKNALTNEYLNINNNELVLSNKGTEFNFEFIDIRKDEVF